MQRLTQKTTGFAHADWRETRKNDKVSVGYEVDIRRLGVMDKITIAIADDQEITVEMLSNIVASQDDFVLAGTARKWRGSIGLGAPVQTADFIARYDHAAGGRKRSNAAIAIG